MTTRPDFQLATSPVGRCEICSGTTDGQSIRTFQGPIPVTTICAQCALGLTRLVAANAAAFALGHEDCFALSKAFKASGTDEAMRIQGLKRIGATNGN
jgi:hypothetical protein